MLALAALPLLTGCGEKEKPVPKQYKVTPIATTEAPAETPDAQPPSAGKGAAGQPMSANDQATMQARFVAPGTPWATKTPEQKRNAYYGWAQQYMFGDAATKSRVLGEIRKSGLSPDDLRDLQQLNSKLTFPPLPL